MPKGTGRPHTRPQKQMAGAVTRGNRASRREAQDMRTSAPMTSPRPTARPLAPRTSPRPPARPKR